mmetsp:Transcript_37833/g.55573  ORF Transcript_37833/g.55573 Transcript_37833/m.55573 type:complete len:275 (+) Transcript_37833:881-1705(+)
MYRVCSSCGADCALLKCACLAAYYCNLTCQQKHHLVHQCECTEHLLKVIVKKRTALDRLKEQSSPGVGSVELMTLEQELAREYCKVGRLKVNSLQPAIWPEAATHCQQALHLHRKVEISRGSLRGAAARAAAGKLVQKVAPYGLYDTLRDLGDIYRLMQKDSDALRVLQEALVEVRSDIAQESTPQLQEALAEILHATGSLYIDQHYGNRQIKNWTSGSATKALLEEALSIRRTLARFGPAASELFRLLADVYRILDMHDEARNILKEALDLGF